MTRRILGGAFAALAAATVVTGGFSGLTGGTGTATAHPVAAMPAPQQSSMDGRDWRDPGAPPDVDRHCDRRGFWHNDDNDFGGRPDPRCHPW